MSQPRPLWKRPLPQFLAVGALLVGVDLLRQGGADQRDIVLSEAQRTAILAGLAEQQAVVGPEDEAGALEAWATDEALYREALRLGLDQHDVVVRRRLVQKMRFLIERAAPPPSPTETELAGWLAANPDRYVLPARTSLVHVYVRSSADAETRAQELAGALASGADAATLGDPYVHGREFSHLPAERIATVLGPGFLDELDLTEHGVWQGPVASDFGLHLVRVDGHDPARPPALDEVRNQVEVDWQAQAQARAEAAAVAEIRSRYTVSEPR